MEPIPKRARAEEPKYDWCIHIQDTSGFRAVIDAMASVLPRANIQVCKYGEEGDYLLTSSGADLASTSIVSVRLFLSGEHVRNPREEEKIEFCVDCKIIRDAVNTTTASHSMLRLEGHGDRVHVCVYGGTDSTACATAQLKRLVHNDEPVELMPLEMATRVEMNIFKLREFIKLAHKWHAEHMRLRIFLRSVGSVTFSRVVYSFDGDADYAESFCNPVSKDEDGSLYCVADGESTPEDPEGGERGEEDLHFEGVFGIDRIDAFIKIIPTKKLYCDVAQDMPFMCTHNLGDGTRTDSVIYFVTAPINDVD